MRVYVAQKGNYRVSTISRKGSRKVHSLVMNTGYQSLLEAEFA